MEVSVYNVDCAVHEKVVKNAILCIHSNMEFSQEYSFLNSIEKLFNFSLNVVIF